MKFSNDKKVIYSGVFFIVMLLSVMLLFNPMIDGGNGMGLIDLQLSFDKTKAIAIVKSWGENGVLNFNKWIFTDYIYALSYALFFSYLMAHFKATKSQQLIPYFAGFFDWIEDSLELVFINNQQSFTPLLFTIHTLSAIIKFVLIGICIYIIFNVARYRKPQ